MLEYPLDDAWDTILYTSFIKQAEEVDKQDVKDIVDSLLGCRSSGDLYHFLTTGHMDDYESLSHLLFVIRTHDEDGEPIFDKNGKRLKDAASAYERLDDEFKTILNRKELSLSSAVYENALDIDHWALKRMVHRLLQSKDDLEEGGLSDREAGWLRGRKTSEDGKHGEYCECASCRYDVYRTDVRGVGKEREAQLPFDEEWVSSNYYREWMDRLKKIQRRARDSGGKVPSEREASALAHAEIKDRFFQEDRVMSDNRFVGFMNAVREEGLFHDKHLFRGANYQNLTEEDIYEIVSKVVDTIAKRDVKFLADTHMEHFYHGKPVSDEVKKVLDEDLYKDMRDTGSVTEPKETKLHRYEYAKGPKRKARISQPCEQCKTEGKVYFSDAWGPNRKDIDCPSCEGKGWSTVEKEFDNEYDERYDREQLIIRQKYLLDAHKKWTI